MSDTPTPPTPDLAELRRLAEAVRDSSDTRGVLDLIREALEGKS